MHQSLRDCCTRYGRTELIGQWHPSRNDRLTPDLVLYGSQKNMVALPRGPQLEGCDLFPYRRPSERLSGVRGKNAALKMYIPLERPKFNT